MTPRLAALARGGLPEFTPIRFPASTRPQLHVVVDTEEEFDWSAPFSRENVSVTAIQDIPRLQNVLAAYGVRPTYVVDYPVAGTASSAGLLSGLAASGACEIGAHLHPWEIDPDQPRLPADWLGRFRHYRNLHATEGRLRRLLRDFRFGPLRDVLASRLASLASTRLASLARDTAAVI